MIYLDNAATTRHKPAEVTEAMIAALQSLGNAGRGQHEDSLSADRTIYEARLMVSNLFGAANPRQVAFAKNSTEALNLAINGLIEPGDHVITTAMEHNSVLRPIYRLADEGAITFDVAGLDENGNLLCDDFERLLTDQTRVVIVNHGSNVTGNLADLDRISSFCRAHGLKLIVDASQTGGVFPIDMTSLGITALCFTGHKSLLGPQGTGGICLAEGTAIRPLCVGGSGIKSFERAQPEEMPTRLEAGTQNGHGIAGLLAALRFIEAKGIDSIRDREQQLARSFYEGIRSINGIRIYGDFSTRARCPIVSMNIGEADAALVSFRLQEDFGIATRPGAHCAPLVHEHFRTRDQGMVRFSFSSFNTMDEVNSAIDAIRSIARDELAGIEDR